MNSQRDMANNKLSIIKQLNITLIFSCLILVSCKDSKKQFTYLDTADSEIAFHSEKKVNNIIRFDNAHSGNYVYKLNKESPFSGTFYLGLSDVFPGSPKKALLSAWILTEQINSALKFTLEIRDKDFNLKEWLGSNANDKMHVVDEWTYVEFEFDLLTNNRNNSENFLRAYIYSNTNLNVYADDIEVRFY